MDLTRFNDLADIKSLTTDYKLIETNTLGNFIRISLLDENKKVVKVLREIYFGVTPENIDGVDTTINTSKNVILRKR